jgi:adenylylsulfate kinase-like enzyme
MALYGDNVRVDHVADLAWQLEEQRDCIWRSTHNARLFRLHCVKYQDDTDEVVEIVRFQ